MLEGNLGKTAAPRKSKSKHLLPWSKHGTIWELVQRFLLKFIDTKITEKFISSYSLFTQPHHYLMKKSGRRVRYKRKISLYLSIKKVNSSTHGKKKMPLRSFTPDSLMTQNSKTCSGKVSNLFFPHENLLSYDKGKEMGRGEKES